MEYHYDGPFQTVELKRAFDVTPQALFRAWTDPAIARNWLFAGPDDICTHEMAVTPGGSYRIVRSSGGTDYVAVGEYLEVDPPHRLVFTFAMPQFAADVGTCTVEVSPAGQGAGLTFTQSHVRPGDEAPTIEGWEAMFDLLAQALESGSGGARPFSG